MRVSAAEHSKDLGSADFLETDMATAVTQEYFLSAPKYVTYM